MPHEALSAGSSTGRCLIHRLVHNELAPSGRTVHAMKRSQFPRVPRPKASKSQRLPRRPRDWRQRTHVCVNNGVFAHDDVPICGDCGMRGDHRVHDLNQDVVVAAAEIDARKLGEG